MSRRLPPFNSLMMFEAAARHLSVSRAAEELNLTPSAVSRQISQFETYLGRRLFYRTSKGLRLKPFAQQYVSAISSSLRDIVEATNGLSGKGDRSVLTVQAYPVFMNRWLIPKLPDFKMQHPNVEVRLVSASEPVDFKYDHVDIGIRYGRGKWSGLASDLLFRDRLTPVCAPKLLENKMLSDLIDSVPLLCLHVRENDWADWFSTARLPIPKNVRRLYFEDLGILYQCALDGFGIAMGQEPYLAPELKLGTLIAPSDVMLERQSGYYLVCPERSMTLSKIVNFRTWLRRKISGSDAISGV